MGDGVMLVSRQSDRQDSKCIHTHSVRQHYVYTYVTPGNGKFFFLI